MGKFQRNGPSVAGNNFSTTGTSLGMAVVSAGLGHFLGDRTGAVVAAGIAVLVEAVEADQEQSDLQAAAITGRTRGR